MAATNYKPLLQVEHCCSGQRLRGNAVGHIKKMKEINSVNDFLSVIQERSSEYKKRSSSVYKNANSGPHWYKYNPNLWFRGHSNIEWKLLPKVNRDSFINAAKNAGTFKEDYEHTILHQFLVQSSHLLNPNLTLTDKYFLAQHHGLPTRLLDWSTNPLVALFFASLKDEENDAAIFIMFSRGDFNGARDEDVMYQDDDTVTSYINSIIHNIDPRDKKHYPLRIIPNSQIGRVLAQGSRFTFHFENSISLEQEMDYNIFIYKIPYLSKKIIREELSLLNISWATLFPDLDNLIKEIKLQTNTL